MDTTFCYTTQKIANGWVLLIWSEWWKQCTWIPVVIENKLLGSITPLQLCDCCQARDSFYICVQLYVDNVNLILYHTYPLVH
jgi:hypothetical protein